LPRPHALRRPRRAPSTGTAPGPTRHAGPGGGGGPDAGTVFAQGRVAPTRGRERFLVHLLAHRVPPRRGAHGAAALGPPESLSATPRARSAPLHYRPSCVLADRGNP